MEWSDIFESSSNPNLFSPFTPQFEVEPQYLMEWTFEENKVFENALAEFGLNSPAFFEHVAFKLPYKSMEQIKRHYDCLIEDVEMIESGLFPTPKYESPEESIQGDVETKSEKACVKQARKASSGHQRKRGVPWTEEEHQLFLMGLNKYGKGDWRSISRYYVVTKTPTQVASHAQKFFRRQTSTTPTDRRRPSIHDIQTVNSTFFSVPQKHKSPILTNELRTLNVVPLSNPYDLIPMYNHTFPNNDLTNFTNEIPVLPPGTSTFPMVMNSFFNYPSGVYPCSSSYPIPYPRNYP
ncbi:transcription factor SRM1-like [Actinidia eriantha]|uniref:transcription factor SRM1-like n=1 Tax=Actinidia eriantha TaxID=165200 RepID=UPI00258F2DDB|nr:transcription factor SRM1-like [Actinidia eriantha]